jgi:Protein of unknown function DUF262
VPRFQRPFVWDKEDVRRLFDSIWRGFPIGTLLFWKSSAPADEIEFGPVSVRADAITDAPWVVDGQQRVTTLVGTLAETSGSDPTFDVCFDLRRERFVHAGRRPLPSSWLPLRVVLESRTYVSWTREKAGELEPDELDRADELAASLRDYKVLAYIVEHDAEELLRDVFDRVNSAGKPISRAQVFHALFGGYTAIASAAAVVAALRHEGFGDLDEQRVVQSLLAIRGGDVARDLHGEFAPNEDRAPWFDDTERALSRVIGFLRRHGVTHVDLVPSTFPIPVLAAFFHLHPDVEPWIDRLLARWLWRGWAHGYGRSGSTPALRQAVRAVHPTRGEPQLAPSAYDALAALLSAVPDETPSGVEAVGFRTDSVSGRLALLALVHLEPRRPSGEPLDVTLELSLHGSKAVTELVHGWRSNIGARGFWPVDELLPTGDEPPDVLASHAIDERAAAALRAGEVDRFVAERSAAIQQLVLRFVTSRVEPKAALRPPLAQLFVPDEDLDEVS